MSNGQARPIRIRIESRSFAGPYISPTYEYTNRGDELLLFGTIRVLLEAATSC